MERVWMVHKDLPGERISCAPSGVGARQASGWVVDETQDAATVAAAEQPAPAYVHRLLDALDAALAGQPVEQIRVDAGVTPAEVLARVEEIQARRVEQRGEDEAAPAAELADKDEEE